MRQPFTKPSAARTPVEGEDNGRKRGNLGEFLREETTGGRLLLAGRYRRRTQGCL